MERAFILAIQTQVAVVDAVKVLQFNLRIDLLLAGTKVPAFLFVTLSSV
jgi:hypothetical protein